MSMYAMKIKHYMDIIIESPCCGSRHDNITLRIDPFGMAVDSVYRTCYHNIFVKAGCHSNTNISNINSLRQMALLFFEKEELIQLANFQFQNKFVIPFGIHVRVIYHFICGA
eukprot:476382_1